MAGLKAARAAFAWLAACAAAQGAEVTVGTRAFTTYPFGDPDPVPCTAERRYPYFRYDGSTARPCTQVWQVVALENARLRVELLPQVGGKVYRAFDKVAGRDFLYCNRVLKFRDIAMRGPWLSGGIEFNFGIIGHAPSSATPVDWCVRTNADASVSCFVAANEYITRTAWQVEVRLAPDADAFETRTTWMNTSNLPQPYYHWMNAAYGVRGNPKLVFPGTAAIGHEGEVEVRRWPHDARGRDLSVYANNAYGGNKSYHVLPGANGFYAVWWPDAGYGSFHRNLPYEKFGRKIWLWALSRQGAIWEDLLTDADGQYMELQSGRCFNQPRGGNWRTPFKHPTFAPGATERFAESWGPVRDLKEIEAEAKAAQPAARPVDAPAGFDWGSAWGLYVRGEQALRERDDRLGAASLRAALAKDACLSPALTCLAGYEFRRGGYDAARALARRALAVNAYDAEANYLDGFAAFVARDFATARERLGVAALAPAFRAPALALGARSHHAAGAAAAADAAAEKALAANDGNWDARLARLVAARGTPDAVRRADALLADLPLCHAARYERAKAVPGEDPWAFVANELPGELFVELGSWYEETGLLEDAAALFAAAPRTHLVAQIRRAHVLARLGRADAARAALAAARALPPAGAFPFRRESLPALRMAAKDGGRWTFDYLLAVALAAFQHDAEADALLARLGDTPDAAVFYQYRATRVDGARRLADLRRAEALGGGWRAARALAEHFEAAGDGEAMLRETTAGLARHPACNPLQILHARALCGTKRYRACLDFLKGVVLLPSEHRDTGTAIWHAAQTALGLPLTWPENLGEGEPFPPEGAND
ncbi:MAG: DUF5107 domain-containing protein [bacterium]|nr:DUF5107 domain-containing protein [bacterium]